MTATTSRTSRAITSTHLYSAALILIGMAVPHVIIGLQAHWPGQIMSAHVLLVALTLFAGMRAEHIEREAEAQEQHRRPKKKINKALGGGIDNDVIDIDARFRDIRRHLDDL